MPFSRFNHLLQRLAAKGKNVVCSCCGKQSRRFFPAGVVTKRKYARCAFCSSLERHRLVALMLKDCLLPRTAKVLAIAPEQPLIDFLKQSFDARITTLDLFRTDVDVQGDVRSLPFPNASFDMIVANHVLEHVTDDTAAMREVARVLKPGGQAILQTPIHWDLEKTDEDPSIKDPAERLRRFGQDDHVRLYGRDFVERIRSVDWSVELLPVNKQLSPKDIYKYGLEEDEVFFRIVTKKV